MGRHMLNKKTVLLALLCCLLWGSAFPTVKTLFGVLSVGSGYGVKILLAGIRFSLAGAILLVYYMLRYQRLPMVKGRAWGQVLLLGMIQTGLMYSFYYIAFYNITGVKASILSQMSIFLVVILSHYVYHDDKMHLGKWLGLGMGLMGILMVNFNSLSGVGMFSFSLVGEGFMIISGLFSTMSTFYVKRVGRQFNPILLNGWQLFSGGLMMLFLGLITAEGTLDFSHKASVPLLVYSSLISSGSFTIWYLLLQNNKASQMAMIRFSVPVFGSILSAAFIPGERLTAYVLISLVLVSAGIYQCNRPVVEEI